jgi:glutathione S-transferase
MPAMKLYYNPVSSYSMKTLMAFFEKDVPFEANVVNLMDPAGRADYEKIHPIGKVPYLRLEGLNVYESTVIIEYIDEKFPTKGQRLVPADADKALLVRMRDRFFDFYVNDSMQKIFFDGMRPAGKNDAFGVEQAMHRLKTAYVMADEFLKQGPWACGESFSMADCAAAPPLFYAKNILPFDDFKNLSSYAGRVMERPSFQRALKEAMPILQQMNFGKK